MSGPVMLCRSWGIAALVVLAGVLGCVEVPDNIRAQFAGPGQNDRTNYRPGNHGVEPPVAKASTTSTTTTTGADASDASVATPTPTPIEGDAGTP